MTAQKLKAAVIGAGWYGAENHIPVLSRRPEVVLDGVCRLGSAELERVRSHFGFAFASEDYREVLARKPDIVVVSTPHQLHYAQACDAIEAGAHVLCEKPLTLDPAEAWDLVARARRRGRHLLVANGYQYMPHTDELRRILREGGIGRIESLLCTFVSATRTVFEGDVGLERWQRTFFRPDRATWQNPAQGGGFAYGQLSHSLALMLWLTGLTPRTVDARTYNRDGVDLCDAATVAFAEGAVGSLHGAAAMPEGNRALLHIIVTGSEGMVSAEFERDRCEIRRFDGGDRTLPIEPGQWAVDGKRPTDTLVDLALGRGENRSPGEIGAGAVSLIEAMLRSAARGEAVEVYKPKGD